MAKQFIFLTSGYGGQISPVVVPVDSIGFVGERTAPIDGNVTVIFFKEGCAPETSDSTKIKDLFVMETVNEIFRLLNND